MAKKVVKIIKLQIPAGKANPAPPVGPALGAAQVNIMSFCKEFNERTKNQIGDILPVEITVYADKTFTFITKKPPTSRLILKELALESGSKVPNRDKIGVLTISQVKKIVDIKICDMRVKTPKEAIALVMGTARSMGVDVIEG